MGNPVIFLWGAPKEPPAYCISDDGATSSQSRAQGSIGAPYFLSGSDDCLFVKAKATNKKKNADPNKFIYDPYDAIVFHPVYASG